jgi:hypothetical protein
MNRYFTSFLCIFTFFFATTYSFSSFAASASDATEILNEDDDKTTNLSHESTCEGTCTYEITSSPANGAVTLTGSSATYTADADYNGSDSYDYQVHDDLGESSSATIYLTINPINDKPIATTGITAETNEDSPIEVTVGGTDIDGDTLTLSNITSTSQGSAEIIDAEEMTVRFIPNEDYYGEASFNFKVHDGTNYSETSAEVIITVVSVNDAPVADDVEETLNEDSSESTYLKTNSDDVEDDVDDMTYTIVTEPSHGSYTIDEDYKVTYIPDENYHGTDSYQFQATDTESLTSTPGTVQLTINPVNDRPLATDGLSAVTYEENAITVTVSGTDIDGDDLTVYNITSTSHGTAEIVDAEAMQVLFTPDAGYHGDAGFNFKVHDGTTYSTSSATFDILVYEIDETPIASDGNFQTDEDTATDIDLSTLVNDDDGVAGLSYSVETMPTDGALTLTGTTATYTPSADYNGSDEFTYKVIDGSDLESEVATITLTVNPINDTPTAEDINTTIPVNLPTAITLLGADVDGDSLTYIIPPLLAPDNGNLTLIGDKAIYVPDYGYIGEDSFRYFVSDGIETVQGEVTIDVGAINQAPVGTAATVTVDEETSVNITLYATDAEGDTITYSIHSDPLNGELGELDGNEVTYTPDGNFFGEDSFYFKASDGSSSSTATRVTINVTNVNDEPIALNVNTTTAENTSVEITLAGVDPDNEALVYKALITHNGTTSIENNVATFTPNSDYNGFAVIEYLVSDYQSLSEPAFVNINVTGSNDAPTADDIAIQLKEDQFTKIKPQAQDPENNPLNYQIVSGPTNGSVSISHKKFHFEPDEDYYGEDSFTYQATDPSGAVSNTATVSINISAQPDTYFECDDVDDSHIQTEGDVQYWDNLVYVSLNSVATEDELNEILTTASATDIICRTEQEPLTEDEGGDDLDPENTGYSIYMIDVGAQASIDDLVTIADNVAGLSYVNSAYAGYVDTVDTNAEFMTDVEAKLNDSHSIDPYFFGIAQLQGSLEYSRAFLEQGGNLYHVLVGIADTGVCASSAYSSECSTEPTGIVDEFDNTIVSGDNQFLTLDSSSSIPDSELGLVDKSTNLHGTTVASLLAAQSNGSNTTPILGTSASGPQSYTAVSTYSGILGSVFESNYTLVSYLAPISNYSTAYSYATRQKNPFSYLVSQLCAQDVSNISVSPPAHYDYENITTDPNYYNIIMKHEAMKKSLSTCNDSLLVIGGGNNGHDLSDGNWSMSSYATTTDLSGDRFSFVLGVQASNYGSDLILDLTSEYGDSVTNYNDSYLDVVAPGFYTSYSTPMVTGAAALAKSIAPFASPEEIKEIIISSGKRTDDTNTPFLDIAAATLMAIQLNNPDFIPVSVEGSSYYSSSFGLQENKIDFTEGGHSEDSFWDFKPSEKNLIISRLGHEFGFAVNTSGESEDIPVLLTFHTDNTYDLALSVLNDQFDVNRRIPSLIALPSLFNSYTVQGGYLLPPFSFYIEDGGDATYSEADPNSAKLFEYCLDLNYDMNEEFSAESDGGFAVPLARSSTTTDYTIPLNIRNAGLLINAKITIGDIVSVNPSVGCSSGELIPDDVDENFADYDAWRSDVVAGTFEETTCPDYVCRIGMEACCINHYGDEINWPGCFREATDDDCTTTEQQCSYSTIEPEAGDLREQFMEVSVAFDDFDCAAVANSTNEDLWTQDQLGTSSSDQDVTIGDRIFQTFAYHDELIEEPVCQTVAHVSLERYRLQSYIANSPDCPGEEIFGLVELEQRDFDLDVSWNYDHTFPVQELLDEIGPNYAIYYSVTHPEEINAFTHLYGGEATFLQEKFMPADMTTPSFDIGKPAWRWSHGLGPLKSDDSSDEAIEDYFEATHIRPLNRNMY